jgi:hypothetical protein
MAMTMNNQALFLFLILLAGLVLCSFLGRGYGHEGFDSIPTYTGVNTGQGSNVSSPSLGGQGNVYIGSSTNVSKQPAGFDNYNHFTGTSTQPNAAPPGNGMMNLTPGQNPYSSVLPQGIPKSQIPGGQEDLYILKSEVIPPVCPVCPAMTATSTSEISQEKCPPCPACARCPEPAFECKKVPNYNSASSEFLPVPVLNSFSSFGM